MIMGLHRPDQLLVALHKSPAISWPLIGRAFSTHWDKLMASLPSPYLLWVILHWIRTISSYHVISLSVSTLLHTHHWLDLFWTWQMNSLWASIDLIDFLPQFLIHLLELSDKTQVRRLSSCLLLPGGLSSDFSQCQIYPSALGALVFFSGLMGLILHMHGGAGGIGYIRPHY